ncbi:hypothetical protein K461DRAFT_275123 [Myriangium duriaei CBS 260.36]|uniref:Uncharacterized protein n=1 Tax=Myriangium duriaei CBS 260.36 TaxID=1168546 RepID=A0A9P4J9R0_9PEZI|nr:hypothetical protein K461DRAFT_275123 [Myriangium duriaei CBS 260.36]
MPSYSSSYRLSRLCAPVITSSTLSSTTTCQLVDRCRSVHPKTRKPENDQQQQSSNKNQGITGIVAMLETKTRRMWFSIILPFPRIVALSDE